jgi:hypothetical protein
MPKTLYAMGTMTASEAWRDIRSLRAEPAGALRATLDSDPRRRNEFHMALEQGQQQFLASQQIGFESRPLNLFYGLSQTGRALAAGSRALGLDTGHSWEASGHGIKFQDGVSEDLWRTATKLEPGKRDLFSRASIATDSPHGFSSIEFGALVNQLVDYTMTFRENEAFPRPLHDVRVYSSPTCPVDIEVQVPGYEAGSAMSAEDVRMALAAYPALSPFVVLQEGQEIRWSHNEGYCLLSVPSRECFVEESHGSLTLKGSTRYRGSSVLLPSVDGEDRPLRPLMAWWLVLHALSMLARYTPSRWMRTLSLDQSPIASKVEFLLDAAVHAVPELLVDEIRRLQD